MTATKGGTRPHNTTRGEEEAAGTRRGEEETMPSVVESPPIPQGKKRRRDETDEDSLHHHHHHHHHHHQPSILTVDRPQSGAPLHFRPFEEDIEIYSPAEYSQSPGPRWHAVVPRKVIPLPVTKRQRVLHVSISGGGNHGDDYDNDDRSRSEGGLPRDAAPAEPTPASTSTSTSTAPPASTGRAVLRHQRYAGNRSPARTTTTTTNKALAPCNVCRRRPTKKSELDSYADCEGCGQRTCFICMRRCAGWLAVGPGEDDDGGGGGMDEDASLLSEQELLLSRSFHMDDAPPASPPPGDDGGESQATDGFRDRHHRPAADSSRDGIKSWAASGHRGMVCSRCCIEKGAEGDIICLGCLARMEGA